MRIDLCKLSHIGIIKTIWFNLRVLPFKEAVRFPIVLARNVRIGKCYRGCVSLEKGGTFHVGFHGMEASFSQKSLLEIEGRLVLKGNGFHVFAPGLIIRIAKGGVLQIGNNFSCHRNNTFIIYKSVIIGDDNMWSFEILTMDTDSHVIFDTDGVKLNPNKEIVIGNNVWVGCRNTILKGSIIPNGSIIGACGVITRKLEKPMSCYLGNSLHRQNVIWERTRNLETVEDY